MRALVNPSKLRCRPPADPPVIVRNLPFSLRRDRVRTGFPRAIRLHTVASAGANSLHVLQATSSLREASREMVETFVNNLAEWAANDRAGLVCHLNSYAHLQEVTP